MAAAQGWIDFAMLSDYVKSHLQKGADTALKQHWDTVINAALKTGYWEIVTAFARKGFSKAQVDQWDRGAEFHLDIGLWFAMKRLAVLYPDRIGQDNLNDLDRRKELWGDEKEGIPIAILTIDGVPQEPVGDYGQPNTGPMDMTTDMFREDPLDVRRGEVTQF